MSDTSGAVTRRVGPYRRVCAVLLSLVVPGAGHCLLGASRRGVLWPVGLAILALLLLYTVPVAASIWSQFAVNIVGRVGAAIDAVRIVRPAPAWRRVALGWAAVVVSMLFMDFAVVTPLATYYAQRYAQAFVIRTGGMEPTLLIGDSLIIDRSAYRDRAPGRNDLVFFPHPEDEERNVIQRIVGMPGDVVVMRGEQVSVNGQVLRESYLDSRISTSPPAHLVTCPYACEPTTVPADSYFMLGDNRTNSEDSRFFGFIKRDRVKGKAHSIYSSVDPQEGALRPGRIGRLP